MTLTRDKRKHTLKVDYSKVAKSAFVDSLRQLNPKQLIKNPIPTISAV